MNGFWGADTDALRTMGTIIARRANLLTELEARLSTLIDGVTWAGEDAEHFRAEWSRRVRRELQDQEFELRLRARRLVQHADEQDEAAAPDRPVLGGAGWSGPGWSGPGESRRPPGGSAGPPMAGLVDHGPGQGTGAGLGPGPTGPSAELLHEVLTAPVGRTGFLGAGLSALLGLEPVAGGEGTFDPDADGTAPGAGSVDSFAVGAGIVSEGLGAPRG